MNKRAKLKQDLFYLALFGGGHLDVFRRLYAGKDIDAPIGDIVDKMKDTQIKWAIEQVRNSINKLKKT